MTDPKFIYIAEHERLIAEAEDRGIDRGIDRDTAYDLTADAAYDAMRDRYADMADMARMRAKEG